MEDTNTSKIEKIIEKIISAIAIIGTGVFLALLASLIPAAIIFAMFIFLPETIAIIASVIVAIWALCDIVPKTIEFISDNLA